jgi:hypothetical protein
MNTAKLLIDLRSGYSVSVRLVQDTSLLPLVKLRLVPDFMTGSQILWSIGVYRGQKCVRRWPALSPQQLEERLYGMEHCND